MITNEQRAHDYAISVLPFALDKAKEERESLKEISVIDIDFPDIDAFDLYLSIYERALGRLNNQ